MYTHFQSEKIPLCNLAGDFIQKNGKGRLKIERYSVPQLLGALEAINQPLPEGRPTKKKIAALIVEHVQATCPNDCLSIFKNAKVDNDDVDDDDDNEEKDNV